MKSTHKQTKTTHKSVNLPKNFGKMKKKTLLENKFWSKRSKTNK